MTAQEKLDAILAVVRPLAAKDRHSDSDDFNPNCDSGGNYDDAYAMGEEDGEIGLAYQIEAICLTT